MPTSPNDNAINGNSASGNAKQNNVIQNTINQNTQHILTLQLPNNLWPPPEIPIEQFRKGQGPQLDRIWGVEVEKYLVSEYQDQAAREHSHRSSRSTKASYCFIRNADFPELAAFERRMSKNLAQYPNTRNTRCVLDILKTQQKHDLSLWASSRKSRALLLDFPSAMRERLHWTTNFSMEIIGRINWSNQGKDARLPKAVVAHFCDSTKSWTQQLAVRDFLAQLRRARGKVLKANHVCGGDDNIYHDNTKGTGGLWDLLLHSVKRAGIEELYLVIDNFDSIQSQVGTKLHQEFRESLWIFAQASQANKVPVKILVTSRSPQADNCFPEFRRIRLALDPRERAR